MILYMTGCRGYLGTYIKKELQNINIKVFTELDTCLDTLPIVDIVLHLGTPSQADDKYTSKYKTELLDKVSNLIQLSNSKNAVLIFASSAIILDNIECDYKYIKKESEKLILRRADRYINLRIPRIYSSCRKKGLIKTLKDNTFVGDMNTVLEYMTIEDFLKELIIVVRLINSLYNYDREFTTQSGTISQIKERFIDIDIDK